MMQLPSINSKNAILIIMEMQDLSDAFIAELAIIESIKIAYLKAKKIASLKDKYTKKEEALVSDLKAELVALLNNAIPLEIDNRENLLFDKESKPVSILCKHIRHSDTPKQDIINACMIVYQEAKEHP